MKQILTIIAFFVLGYEALASDTAIIFRQINYADLFDLAKKEKKAVMLYFHFDGCGACVTMGANGLIKKYNISDERHLSKNFRKNQKYGLMF